MEQEQRNIRYRIGFNASVKGIVQPDATVEATGYTLEEYLELHDEFMKAVRERYPVQKE